jgi:hypothetical protein
MNNPDVLSCSFLSNMFATAAVLVIASAQSCTEFLGSVFGAELGSPSDHV